MTSRDLDAWSSRVDEITLAAAELSDAERKGYLDAACGGDAALQSAVEARLEVGTRSGEGEADVPSGPELPATQEIRTGGKRGSEDRVAAPGGTVGSTEFREQWIGPYRILEVLGEGGMGTVFLAEQLRPIERRVAVKVMQTHLRTASDRLRFEVERRSLARMSHPNIAQVYEAGQTEEGLPYVAMELVEGQPITRYCDRKGLSIDERLQLFEAVCRGVHHAHQKGILHRDIKPTNILVTEVESRPLPKIIDFGLAKSLDQIPGDESSQLTGKAMVIGTPSYLSPESILAPGESDPDIRTDVYGLGILLFELLVGEVPFARHGGNVLKMARQIMEEQPTAPSRRFAALDPPLAEARASARGCTPGTLVRQLRGDIDWIALQAIAKEREQRYSSAAELAEEVARHRRHEPVVARPPSLWYQAGKFARRHTTAVVAAALVLLALVGGIAARTVEAQRAEREADRANLEADRANREAEAARQVSDFLVELFEVSDPGESQGDTITARELLDRGAEKIRTELGDQPLTRARLMITMVHVYRSLGLYDPASPLIDEALALRERELGPDHLAVADALVARGLLGYNAARYEEAEADYRRALAIRRAGLGDVHPDTAEVLGSLGDLYELQGRFREAEPLLRQALALRRRTLGEDHVDVAENVDRLAVLLTDSGRSEEALPLFEEALAIRRRVLGEDHPEIAYNLNGLAIAYARTGDLERSRDLFAESAAIRERVLGPGHADYGQSLNNLGIVHLDLGEVEEGMRLLERAAEIYAGALGEGHPRVGNAWHNIGTAYRDEESWQEAEIYFRRALEVRQGELGRDSPALAPTIHDLGRAVRAQGRLEEAEELFRRALRLRSEELSADDEQVVGTVEDLAEVLREMGRPTEASALEEQYPPSDSR